MAFKKIVFVVLFSLLSILVFGQSKFEDWPIKGVQNDTVTRVFKSTDYFDYFKNEKDAYAVVDFSGEEYEQVLSVHSGSKSGYLRIFFRDTIVFKYEVQGYNVQGIGTKFDYKCRNVLMQGLFEESELNGPLIFYKPFQKIEFIADFRKGKFKGYLYHVTAKSKEKLDEMNKSAENPLQYKLITM